MVKPERQRELIGVGLIALALLVLLALVPVGVLGEAGPRWFPGGNVMGTLGRWIQTGLVFVLGGVAAVLVPLLVGLAGVWYMGRIEREAALRLAVLGGGLLLLVPAVAWVVSPTRAWAGWLGGLAGQPLTGLAGPFGAGFILAVLFVLLSLATLGWNPVETPARWSLDGGRRSWRALVDWLQDRDSSGSQRTAAESAEPEAAVLDRAEEEKSVPAIAGVAAKEHRTDRLPEPRRPAHDEELPDPRDPRELEGAELPPLELLSPPVGSHLGEMERDLDAMGEILVEKLRSFNVESSLSGRTTGPVVTQFEVVPAPGVKVSRIANLDRDLALALRARTVRIVAPIPGKGAVGVEIPNPVPVTVQLREILESRAFSGSRADLPLALGKDLHGAPYVADLAKMPHCLIAGATGSGKSVCLNTIITSLVYRHTPETLRLLLIDPKMVELSTYADLPHLRHPVVTDPSEAAGVLKWAVLEMERRYSLLKENGVRSIGEFNRRVRKGVPLRRAEPLGDEGDPDRWIYGDGVLPFVVLVVDELADLMLSAQSEVEKPLTMLAQKARAIGLHLIVATQRPSVNVITGVIKANFPCRVAFQVASKTDSRTIIDQNGADALLGHGDMLFLPPGQSSPVRMQGAFISTEETRELLDWYRELREGKLAEGEDGEGVGSEDDILEIVREQEAEEAGADDDPFAGEWDEKFRAAGEVVISNDQGSTSLLQRRLRVGYGRAARIVDQLHDAGVLGPPDGSKPREVLMNMEQFERMMSGADEAD